MTIGQERTPTTHAQSGATADTPDATAAASTAKQESSHVANAAVQGGRDVAHDVADQVGAVADSAKDQLSSLMGQAKQEFATQGEARGQQVIGGIQTVSDQLAALVEGRSDEAGNVGTVAREAQQRLQSYVGSLQDRGPRGLTDDVTSFARRRPGSFLLISAAVGFTAGRLVRSGAANDDTATDDQQSSQDSRPTFASDDAAAASTPPSPDTGARALSAS